MMTGFEKKLKAAYEHGRLDYLAGYARDPQTPLIVYKNLGIEQQMEIMASWMNGWTDESIVQSLHGGFRA